MNGNSLFVDSNVILYLISGDATIAELLNGKHVFISFITELELLGFKDLIEEESTKIQEFIDDSTVTDINAKIKKLVISLRKNYNLKLPDSIIAASALYHNLPLITADKQLGQISELNILLYQK